MGIGMGSCGQQGCCYIVVIAGGGIVQSTCLTVCTHMVDIGSCGYQLLYDVEGVGADSSHKGCVAAGISEVDIGPGCDKVCDDFRSPLNGCNEQGAVFIFSVAFIGVGSCGQQSFDLSGLSCFDGSEERCGNLICFVVHELSI